MTFDVNAHSERGFDCATPITPFLGKVTAEQVGYVGRYLYAGAKGVTPDEAKAVLAAGVGILLYYEARGDRPAGFSAAQGTADANVALALAGKLGVPEGVAIYPAVDYDAAPGDEVALITPYFTSWKTSLGTRYKLGVYGSGLTCGTIIDAGLADYSVLGAIGWRNGHAFLPRASVIQKPPSDPYHWGLQVDPLIAQVAEFGLWKPEAAPVLVPPPAPHGRTLRFTSPMLFGDDVRIIQAALTTAGYSTKGVDGWFGRDTAAAVRAFKVAHHLPPDDVVETTVRKLLGL